MKNLSRPAAALLAALAFMLPAPVRSDDGRATIVDHLASALESSYVFADRARAASAAIRTHLSDHAYDSGDDTAFAKALTDDVYAVLHDKHIRVNYSARPVPPDRDPNAPVSDADRQAMRTNAARGNYGLAGVQVLPGSVGYVDLRGFADAEFAGPALATAMQFIAGTDAIIIDERRNGGGDPDTVAMLVSYFYPKDTRLHVNDLGMRVGDREDIHATYTSPVAGPRFPNVPVYVLTSARTFSGGEEFAYDIQALKRGTIVGEITGGGANPGEGHRLGEHFFAFIPNGRAINPITHTNWEGVGVKPDVAVSAEEAFKTAYLAALRGRISTAPPDEREPLTQWIATVEKSDPPALVQRLYGGVPVRS
jgi:Peptidase family S41